MAEQIDMFGKGGIVQNPDAYAAFPGSGPGGKTCGDCFYYSRVKHHGQYYRKCGLLFHHWTHGPDTDIKASAAACRFFKQFDPDVHIDLEFHDYDD